MDHGVSCDVFVKERRLEIILTYTVTNLQAACASVDEMMPALLSDQLHGCGIGVFVIGFGRLRLPKWKCVLKKLLIILCKIEIKTSYN